MIRKSFVFNAVLLGLLVPTVGATGNQNKQVATAKKAVRTCLQDATEANWVVESSVTTVSSCFAGGFITDVDFWKTYDCKPNKPCPKVAAVLVATVQLGCDDSVISSVCYANQCTTDADCAADSWCRGTSLGTSECTPYALEGDTCGGFVPVELYEQCDPSLTCVTDPYIADLPGECATCNDKGTPRSAGESWSPDDCNTCTCGDDGLIACTEMACLPR